MALVFFFNGFGVCSSSVRLAPVCCGLNTYIVRRTGASQWEFYFPFNCCE
uniref:Uncharacterized protein n=1 Tax=Anopheles atroparvus TaxID=41427 RepID=A0AAG5CY99_ANOAO